VQVLECGNLTLAGSHAYKYWELESVVKASASLTVRTQRRDHVVTQLRHLHWLHTSKRIVCKLATQMHLDFHGIAQHVAEGFQPIADAVSLQHLLSA
jgi:hypothetical protein